MCLNLQLYPYTSVTVSLFYVFRATHRSWPFVVFPGVEWGSLDGRLLLAQASLWLCLCRWFFVRLDGYRFEFPLFKKGLLVDSCRDRWFFFGGEELLKRSGHRGNPVHCTLLWCIFLWKNHLWFFDKNHLKVHPQNLIQNTFSKKGLGLMFFLFNW